MADIRGWNFSELFNCSSIGSPRQRHFIVSVCSHTHPTDSYTISSRRPHCMSVQVEGRIQECNPRSDRKLSAWYIDRASVSMCALYRPCLGPMCDRCSMCHPSAAHTIYAEYDRSFSAKSPILYPTIEIFEKLDCASLPCLIRRFIETSQHYRSGCARRDPCQYLGSRCQEQPL